MQEISKPQQDLLDLWSSGLKLCYGLVFVNLDKFKNPSDLISALKI